MFNRLPPDARRPLSHIVPNLHTLTETHFHPLGLEVAIVTFLEKETGVSATLLEDVRQVAT